MFIMNCTRTIFKKDFLYEIASLHPECEWYDERQYFEGRIMICLEVFESEPYMAGFIFLNPINCPKLYQSSQSFCFFKPLVGKVGNIKFQKKIKYYLSF